jgi:hypothetical protein
VAKTLTSLSKLAVGYRVATGVKIGAEKAVQFFLTQNYEQ